MIKRNITFAILLILTIFIQSCAARTTRLVQAYYDKNLKESEISWIFILRPRCEDNSIDYLGDIQVNLEKSTGVLGDFVNFRVIALPAGVHQFEVRYYSGIVGGSTFTSWQVMEKDFKGGKCYAITSKAYRDDNSKKGYSFKVEDRQCYIWFRDAVGRTLEMYRLAGPTTTTRLELIKSYKVNDDIFSPFRKTKNNAIITTIPFEFLRKLYEELE